MSEPAGTPELKVWEDARGRRRVSWPGLKGYPVTLRRDESPEQGYQRTLASQAAKAVEDATGGSQAGAGAKASAPAPDPGAGKERARPPGSDPKPRGGRPFGKPRATTVELENVLAELLVLPAIPMGMPVHDPSKDRVIQQGDQPAYVIPGLRTRCEFCRDHFLSTGPQAAKELAKLSETNEPLRRVLERVHAAWGMLSIGGTLGAYLAKPVLHHLAPEPVLEGIGPVLGVPERPPKPPPHTHVHEDQEQDEDYAAAAAAAASPGGPATSTAHPGASPAGL